MSDVGEEVKEEGGKKKPLLLIVIAVVVVLAVAGGAAFFMLGGKDEAGGHAAKKTEAKKGEEAAPTLMKALEQPFVVNLADTDSSRYLKIKVELELENEFVLAEVEQKLPQVNDEIIMLLSSKTFEEVSTVGGKQVLKKQLMTNINAKLKEGRVMNVYFTEFVVQ